MSGGVPSEALCGRSMLVAGHPPVATTVARGTAARGAAVVLCVAGERLAGDVADEARLAGTRSADTSREEEVDAVFDFALERLERLDVLVVAPPPMPALSLVETSLAEWNHAPGAALRGAFLLCRRAIEEWLGAGDGGRIVLVTPGFEPGPGRAGAAVVEGALLSLMRSLVKEYGGRGISCNAVVAAAECYGTEAEGARLVDAIAFLASDESSYVTGECLRLGSGPR